MNAKLERSWWWRRTPPASDEEIPAFRYELVRRLFPLSAYPEYPKLTPAARSIVLQAFGHAHAPVALFHGTPPPFWHDGFTALPEMTWNLRASDLALTTLFLDMIQEARRAMKIERPPRNLGNAN